MGTKKSNSRASSKSPTQGQTKPERQTTKVGNGGVKLPVAVDEKQPDGATNLNGHPSVMTNAPNWKGPQQDSGATAKNGNPFEGNSTKANHNAALSASATSFKPTSTKPAPICFLNRDSTADDVAEPVIVSSDIPSTTKQDKGKGKATQQPIGTRDANFSPTRPRVYFTTDVGPGVDFRGGHYVKVVNAPKSDMTWTLRDVYQAYDWKNKVRGTHCPKPVDGCNFFDIFIAFDDIRDAANASVEIQTVNTNWNVHYITQTEYAVAKKETQHGTPDSTSFYDGQVVFTAKFKGLSSEFSVDGLFNDVQGLANGAGEVLAFAEMDREGDSWQFRAEYFKISDAKHVADTMTKEDPKHIGKWIIFASEMPDLAFQMTSVNYHVFDNSAQGICTPKKDCNDVFFAGMQYVSPTGRSAWIVDENGETISAPAPKLIPKTHMGPSNGMMTPPSRHQSDPLPQTPISYMGVNGDTGPRNASWDGQYYPPDSSSYSNESPGEGLVWGSPTTVDTEKIKSGQDVRTTVMLRNLPNHITFRNLKNLIDEVCFGKYDFSYLRVDFGNNMNVGYGFVNFIDPMHIVTFVERYVGRPWIVNMKYNRKRGPRIADVSYATVQGYDCLVEKFRNSSVMDEFHDFRPKLWFTQDTAPKPSMIGTEMLFPKPNNASKHQRSRDNASNIGLYAPGNRKNRNPHGNRNRHSQYDRGTTAQMREDANQRQIMNNMSPLQNGYGHMNQNYMLGRAQMPVGPSQPQFEQVVFGSSNGFESHYAANYANTAGVMDPYAYGPMQFINPFCNGGHQANQYVPGRVSANGRPSGRPNNHSVSYHGPAYWSGIDIQQIPKAIAEERSGPTDPVSLSNGQVMNGNGYDHTFPPQY